MVVELLVWMVEVEVQVEAFVVVGLLVAESIVVKQRLSVVDSAISSIDVVRSFVDDLKYDIQSRCSI